MLFIAASCLNISIFAIGTKSQIEKLEKEQKDLSNNIQNNNEKKEELSKENTLLEKDQKSILEEIEVLNELKNINNELQKLKNQMNKY